MVGSSRGPEAVRAALIEAATDLFARDGDASVRAVAARAGVNHGLVHHYFGGKPGLRTAVIDKLATSLRHSLDVPDSSSPTVVSRAALRVTEQDPRLIKILARALLDGAVPEQLQTTFPVVQRLLETPSDADAAERRAVIAEGLAMVLGTVVFGAWIRAALGISERELDTIRTQVIDRGLARVEGRA
ncbi:MAG: TetR/AcrR family transcriptional regulator [Deltaproteobacteria bacterium]|nr:TetR/AcrR family transcriptional regulator [Deltaproteobacteria bacterium]